jgi:6,7-dimethyl-8-ribityllumazine synthase
MVVEARFYEDLADELARGALAEIERQGATCERFTVPGAFEIPAAIRLGLEAMGADGSPRFDGFVALGCVIRGETTHYDYVCSESARGLMTLATSHGAAIGFGILTCENWDQAWARAAVQEGDKGRDAVAACLSVIGLRRTLSTPALGVVSG